MLFLFFFKVKIFQPKVNRNLFELKEKNGKEYYD